MVRKPFVRKDLQTLEFSGIACWRKSNDVVALHTSQPECEPLGDGGGVAIAQSPPSARLITRLEKISYAKCADRVVIRHGRGKVVAIIEVVLPGNKDSRSSIRAFVEKAADILNQGVNLLVVDRFRPLLATRTPSTPLAQAGTRRFGTNSVKSGSRRCPASR